MLNEISKRLGIPIDKLNSVLGQAQGMISGVDQSDSSQVQKFMREQGMSQNVIDDLLKNPKVQGLLGAARMGKAMGVPALKNVDIDGMVNTARQMAGGEPSYSNPEYSVREPNYDRRNTDVYRKADEFPS